MPAQVAPALFRAMAQALQAQGRGGDTLLAHITPAEAGKLKAAGGSGTRNPATGLLQFDYSDGSGNEQSGGHDLGTGGESQNERGEGGWGGDPSTAPADAPAMSQAQLQSGVAALNRELNPDFLDRVTDFFGGMVGAHSGLGTNKAGNFETAWGWDPVGLGLGLAGGPIGMGLGVANAAFGRPGTINMTPGVTPVSGYTPGTGGIGSVLDGLGSSKGAPGGNTPANGAGISGPSAGLGPGAENGQPVGVPGSAGPMPASPAAPAAPSQPTQVAYGYDGKPLSPAAAQFAGGALVKNWGPPPNQAAAQQMNTALGAYWA